MPLNRNQDFMFEDTTTLTTNAKSLKGALNEVNASLASIAPQSTSKKKGVSYYFKTDTDINNLSDTTLNQVLNDGATHIVLCPVLVNNDATDNNNFSMSYTTSALTTLVNKILGKGFKIVFKFHLNKQSNGGNVYDTVAPSNPTTAFNNLQSCILTTLNVSQNIDLICMTNESPMITQNYRSNWQTLISAVRAQNPTIKITNSPTFADIQNDLCVFWDLCDYIGTNIYPMVTTNAVPTVQDSIRAMYGEKSPNAYTYVQKLYYLTQKYNKNFIITEFAILPYDYQGTNTGSWTAQGTYDEQVQANYFQGVFNVFLNMEHCAGIFVWNIKDDYTFLNRQAEQVLSSSFKGAMS